MSMIVERTEAAAALAAGLDDAGNGRAPRPKSNCSSPFRWTANSRATWRTLIKEYNDKHPDIKADAGLHRHL